MLLNPSVKLQPEINVSQTSFLYLFDSRTLVKLYGKEIGVKHFLPHYIWEFIFVIFSTLCPSVKFLHLTLGQRTFLIW